MEKKLITHAIIYTSLFWLLLASLSINYMSYTGILNLCPVASEKQQTIKDIFDKDNKHGK